jgi:hypothetical protein
MERNDKDISDALAAYIDVLARGTRYANDRPAFCAHLARAAQMFSAIHSRDLQRLHKLIQDEGHSFGWSYLSPPEGDAVDAAWQKFATLAHTPNDTVA